MHGSFEKMVFKEKKDFIRKYGKTVERDILAGKNVGFGRFYHQRSPSFNISVWHQHLKDVTDIEIPPRPK